MMNYIVQQGDSLSKIARDKLGDITLWHDLAAYNKIKDANRIYPGQVISLDIPQRVTIDVSPKKDSPLVKWILGFFITVASALAVQKINEYQNAKRDDHT